MSFFQLGQFGRSLGASGPYGVARIVALLHADGASGATTTVDSSVFVQTVAIVGAATLSNAWAKFGPTSLSCPNTGNTTENGARITDSVDFDFGTDDFTIEGHFRRSANTYLGYVLDLPVSGGAIYLRVSSTGFLSFQWTSSSGAQTFTDILEIAINTDHWFEIVRRGGILELCINGFLVVSSALVSGTAETVNCTGDIYVGCKTPLGSSESLNGYVDEFCITRTLARPEFFDLSVDDPDSGSVVLMLAGSAFSDSSVNASTITTSGSSSLATGSGGWHLAPYMQGAASSYIRAQLGATGSMTGNFTIEGYISGGGTNVAFMSEGAGYLYNGSFQSYGGPAISLETNLNTWNRVHFAISRVGSSVRTFSNGKLIDTDTHAGTVDLQNLRFGMFVPNGNLHWEGKYGQIRVTAGVGRYAANFALRPIPTVAYGPYD